MPEGDTIFRAAHTLHQALAGQVVTRFETALAHLAAVNDQSSVAGRTVERVEARGKWLLIHFSGDLILVTHMLMSGSWHIYRAGERWQRPRGQMRIVLAAGQYQAVAFNVPVAQFHSAATLLRHTAISGLGPALLTGPSDPAFAADEAARRLLSRPLEEIGNVLLNQRVMAGVGNVFKSEICFACGVNPFSLVSTLVPAEIECLIGKAQSLLQQNVDCNAGPGIVTYTGGRRTTGASGPGASGPGARLWVYRRRGQPCRRCGTAILMAKQGPGARSTFWCPACQPMRSSR